MTSYQDAIGHLTDRIDQTLEQVTDGFPHYGDPGSGRWTTSPNGDWTGGYWTGMLWLTHHRTGADQYREAAERWTELLRDRVKDETVFRGFLFWYGAALGHVLQCNPKAREMALAGAKGLATLYNPAAGAIPLGNQAEEASDVGRGDANVDCVQACALLAWAADELGDPELREIGLSHARRHIEFCVRDDGSVCQSARFDPDTGAMLDRYTHKGYTNGSTWTRAQAWAMLGYATAAALAPEEPRFMEIARATADWWLKNVPQDYVAYWDFDAPRSPFTERDSSGTAIAAAALLKLAAQVEGPSCDVYRSAGRATVQALVNGYLTPTSADDGRAPGILTQGCYNHRIGLATQNELIWGSYYLYEALHVLEGCIDPLQV